MFDIKEMLEELNNIEGLSEILNVIGISTDSDHIIEDLIYKSCIEKCEELGLSENQVDTESLKQSIKEMLEDDNKEGIALAKLSDLPGSLTLDEFESLVKGKKATIEFEIEDLTVLKQVLDCVKPKKVLKKLIKSGTLPDVPFIEPGFIHHLEEIKEKVESGESSIFAEVLKSKLGDDKIEFTAI